MSSVQFGGFPSKGWTKQYPADAQRAAEKCTEKIRKPVSINKMRDAAKLWSKRKSANQGSERPKHSFYNDILSKGVTGSKEDILNEVL